MKVLVIKLSALGDFVLALAAMARIRQAHPEAQITLLTTPGFAKLAAACPYVDQVDTGGRPEGLKAWLALRKRLRAGRFDRVYDLQTSAHSSRIFQVLRPRPPAWSGIAWGCALPHRNRARDAMHTLERQADQLKEAGAWPDAPTAPGAAPPPDVSWIWRGAAMPDPATAARPLALLVPGGSAHRLDKRWPAEHFAEVAERLGAAGFDVVIIGGPQEADLAKAIRAKAPAARDLTGRTDLAGLAVWGARAAIAVGNDTGPMHLIAAAGAPSVVLFSAASDPALAAPRGKVAVLQTTDMAQLQIDEVWRRAKLLQPVLAQA
ncbi:glycosyltransferase family 9 protein [Phenylobacterium immobile]|uniref:glycosyltransferase family 9 protein n=1 Tax=Phenylobacterium immobile TaxID=21 RepID=UPI000A5F1A0B|nr:glycosyltransferase family 9 protein [Phenylobacterium immobile]